MLPVRLEQSTRPSNANTKKPSSTKDCQMIMFMIMCHLGQFDDKSNDLHELIKVVTIVSQSGFRLEIHECTLPCPNAKLEHPVASCCFVTSLSFLVR